MNGDERVKVIPKFYPFFFVMSLNNVHIKFIYHHSFVPELCHRTNFFVASFPFFEVKL